MSSFRQELMKEKIPITVSIGCPYAINTTMFEGFKTSLSWLFPMMDQDYVGKRLLGEFIQKKEIIYVYQYESLLFKMALFLPANVYDYVANFLDHSDYTRLR